MFGDNFTVCSSNMEKSEGLPSDIRIALDVAAGSFVECAQNSLTFTCGSDISGAQSSKANELVTSLRQSIRPLPQDSFIDTVLTRSNGSTQAILEAKDNVVDMCRQRMDCPRSNTVVRKRKRAESESSFNRRLASDCYRLLQFIEGGSAADIKDLFRPVSSADSLFPSSQSSSQQDESTRTYDRDMIASLQAALHQALERIEHVEAEVKHLRDEVSKAKMEHNNKRKDISAANHVKEKEIRDALGELKEGRTRSLADIQELKAGQTKCFADIQSIRRQCKDMADGVDQHASDASSKHDLLQSKVKENARDHRDLQRDLNDVKQRVETLKEPKDTLLSSLRTQVKTLKDKVKAIESDTDGNTGRVTSNTTSITSLREKLNGVVRNNKDALAEIQNLKDTMNTVQNDRKTMVSRNAVTDSTLQGPSKATRDTSTIVSRQATHDRHIEPVSVPAALETNCSVTTTASGSLMVSLPESSTVSCTTGSDEPVPSTSQETNLTNGQHQLDRRQTPFPMQNDVPTPLTDIQTRLTALATSSFSSTSSQERNQRPSYSETVANMSNSSLRPLPVVNHTRIYTSSRNRTQWREGDNSSSFQAHSVQGNIGDRPLTYYIGNVTKTTTAETVVSFFTNEGVKPKFLKIIPTQKETAGNGVKLIIPESLDAKLHAIKLPEGIYLRKWYIKERPRVY